MKKIQILKVHGGMTFKTKKGYLDYLRNKEVTLEGYMSWSGEYLSEKLGRKYQIISPRMPLQDNAKYEEWKIIFEKYLKLLKGDFILIGTSLGGIFLAKYLSENKLRRKPIATYIVCAPFDGKLTNEDLVGGFKLKSDLSLIQNNTKNLHLLFSEDDDVVPVSHAEKYRRKLPDAHIVIYKSKNGHFKISTFPEIIKMIKKDVALK